MERRLDESLAEYSTIEYMEQYVESEFGELAVDFVDQHGEPANTPQGAMYDAEPG
jgi:hypothetical protein